MEAQKDLEDTATGPAEGSAHTHTPLGSDGTFDGFRVYGVYRVYRLGFMAFIGFTV